MGGATGTTEKPAAEASYGYKRQEINCAFETQLRLLRGSMAAEVAGILFPQ